MSRRSLGPVGLFVVLGTLVLMIGACDGGDGGEPPTRVGDSSPTPRPAATQTPEITPTPTSSPEEDVTEAYLAYWRAYGEALLSLDPMLVEGVAADQELQRIREEIEGLRSQGVALRVVVEHNPVILELSDTSAVLFDEIVNNSFYVDPETKEPPEASGSGEVLRDTFYLEKINGHWIVVRSTRHR